MKKNPYNWTFEEYKKFHNRVAENAEKAQRANSPNTIKDTAMSDEEFLKAHNLIVLDDFLVELNKKFNL